MPDDPQGPATGPDLLAIALLVFFVALIVVVAAMLVLPALSG
jgi:hypothetical protein